MKKTLVLFTLVIVGLVIFGCSAEGTSSTFETKEDIIGFSAVSSIIALDDADTATLSYEESGSVMVLSEATTDTTTEQDTTTESDTTTGTSTSDLLAEIEELKEYLPIINSFLGDSSGYSVSVETSEMAEYEHKMLISVTDIDGEMKTYEFHYNETFEDEEADDEEEDQDTEDTEATEEDDSDDDDDERNSTLSGIMVVGEQTYSLTGEREVETGEESLEMTASIDDNNYVIIEYESESEDSEVETEFLSETYKNGDMVKMTEIEFEREDDETELNLHFIEGDNESIFEFEHETDDENTFEISFEIIKDGNVVDEGEIEAEVITSDTGQTQLRYTVEREGQENEVIEDDYDDDDDDDDDDGEDA